MSPPLPRIGAGEPLDEAMSALAAGRRRAGAGRRQARRRGHPLRRARLPGSGRTAGRTGVRALDRCRLRRPSPSTPARSRTRAPARWSSRSTRLHLRPGRRRAGRAAATSTRAAANPTRTALEECLAALEGGRTALAFASGMAANDACCAVLLEPGDHVVIPHDAYGGTFRMVDKVLARGACGTPRSTSATSTRCAPRVRPETKLRLGARRRPTRCWASPTSPRSPSVATTPGRLLVVDNTFASPYLQQPLALGADVGRPLDHQVPRRALRRGRRRAWWPATTSWPSGSPSPRTPPARCPARSTPG